MGEKLRDVKKDGQILILVSIPCNNANSDDRVIDNQKILFNHLGLNKCIKKTLKAA